MNHTKVYGTCYQNLNSFLSGQKINDTIIEKMGQAMTCAESDNTLEMMECTERIKSLNLPLLQIRDSKVKLKEGYKWNYIMLGEKN